MQINIKDSNGSYNESWQMSDEDDTANYSCRKKEIINNRYNVINDFTDNKNSKINQLTKSNEDYILSYDNSLFKSDNIYSKKQTQNIFSLYNQFSQVLNDNPSDYEFENKVSEFRIDNKVINNNNNLFISNNEFINNDYSLPNYKNDESSNDERNQISNNKDCFQYQNDRNISKNTLIQLQNESTIQNNNHNELSSNVYCINSCIPNSNEKINEGNSSRSSYLHFKKQIISRNRNNISFNNDNLCLSSFPSNNNFLSQIHKTANKPKYVNKSQINNFVPSLNENSLRIAANLPSFEERLISDIRKRKTKHRKNYSVSSLHSRNIKNINYNKLSYNITNNNNLCLSIYERGMQLLNKKKEEQQIHKIKKENSFRKYPYKPILNKQPTHSRNKSNSSFHIGKNTNITSSYNKDDIYVRSKRWLQNINNKISKSKIKQTNKIMNKCTFKPHINKKCEGQILTMRDIKKCNNYDNIYHNSNIYCNQYVKRRQKSIENKEKAIIQYNKLFPNGTTYQVKSTFPKAFSLYTHTKKHTKHNNNNVSKKRKELGISSFFEDVFSNNE